MTPSLLARSGSLEAARAALHERMRKQQLARQTQAARVDPAMRALLDQAFERFSLSDPKHRLRDAIAGYPHDTIVDALATFEAKLHRGSLPDGADARYLHHLHESDGITEALLHLRIQAQDHFLAPLLSQRNKIPDGPEPDVLDALTQKLADADRETSTASKTPSSYTRASTTAVRSSKKSYPL